MSTSEDRLTYESDRLIHQWRERYTGRRTVAREMLDQAEVLVRDAIALELEQERRAAKTEREWELERRERQVEHAESLQEWKIDRLRKQLAEAEAKIASMSPRMTLMREERETVEDGAVVRLHAPTVPSYGDKSSPRPWMLGELEDVIYRLRTAGGDDGTEVRFKRDAIEACIPFPEMVIEPRPARTPVPVEQPRRDLARAARSRVDWRLALGLVLVMLAVVAGAVIL